MLKFGSIWQQKGHVAAPPPRWGAEENGKKKAKTGGDMGSLTEQQTRGTVTTMILIRRIHKTK